MKALSTIWECNLTNNGDTVDATITAIYGPTSGICGSTYDYCAWGVDSNGNNFCCEEEGGSIAQVTVIGGAGDDTISLNYSSSNDLDNHGGVAHVDGIVLAGDGVDTISGSRKIGTDYRDKLFGGDGRDTITGLDGDDELSGDEDLDDLDGGGGNDMLNGGSEDDDLIGGDGNDTIYGGENDDQIYGGAGNDTLQGDGGYDIICGGTGVDHLSGGADNDDLWGAESGDTKHGGSGTGDGCDANGTNTSCEFIITDPGCP